MKNLSIYSFILLIFATACAKKESSTEESKHVGDQEKESKRYDLALGDQPHIYFSSLPKPTLSIDDPKAELGRKLYHDNLLSKKKNISCNTCHDLSNYGIDGVPLSKNGDGNTTDRNCPTTLNAVLNSSYFWDSRTKDILKQTSMHLLNPKIMAILSEDFLIKRLGKISEYQQLFKKAFPGDKKPLKFENILIALVSFEKTLITPSKFDAYMDGDIEALSVKEKKGLLGFISTGCVQCHTGNLLGANMNQKFGVHGNYWKVTKSSKIDEGIAAITGEELDRYMFRVPSLRNVEKTAPYIHDGSVSDLNEVVKIIAKLQLDKDLSESEIENIVVFLQSLTGEVPKYAKVK